MALPTSFNSTRRLMSMSSPCWRSTSRNWRKSANGIRAFSGACGLGEAGKQRQRVVALDRRALLGVEHGIVGERGNHVAAHLGGTIRPVAAEHDARRVGDLLERAECRGPGGER